MKIWLLTLLVLLPSVALADGSAYDMIIEKTRYGEISYPQISGGANKDVENSINAIIKAEAETWNCDVDGVPENADSMDYNAWTNMRFNDDRYLSYTVHHDLYCGGAGPNQFIEAYNYDLEGGHPIPTNALLAPELQGEKLTAYLLKDYKFEEEGCGDAYTDINWDYYRAVDHIVFMPRLFGGPAPCWEEFPVAIDEIKDFIRTELPEDRD